MDKELYGETQYILEEFYGKSFDIRYGDIVGKTLKEKYYIESMLKRASKSEVYLVTSNEKKYVAKIVLDKDCYSYIRNEKEILKRTDMDSVVKFIEYFEEGRIDPPVLILEYIEGKELMAFRDSAPEEKLGIIIEILKSLKGLEEQNILHGDIKSENILVIGNKVKFIDFGISNIYDKAIGTVKYMAPETLEKGIKELKTDIYSFSMLAYEFFYEYPYIGRDIRESIVWDSIGLRKEGDLLLELALLKGLNKAADYRYDTLMEYLERAELIGKIYSLSKKEDRLEVSDFYKRIEKEHDARNTFLYHYYLGLRREKVEGFRVEYLNYIIDDYLLSTSYRIPKEGLETFVQRLEEIYTEVGNGKVEEYIKGKIEDRLKGLSFEKELAKIYELEKRGDYSQCAKLSKSLMQKGSMESEYRMGLYYKNGKGVAKDPEKAIGYFEDLIRINYPKAYYQLSQIYQKGKFKDSSKAFHYAEKGAQLGHLGCQNTLAIMYRFGQGVESDMEKAFYWYEKASLGGHVAAQNNLGFMYKNGFGVERNYVEAIKWYTLSATKGNSSAQTNLAFMYREGLGIERNYREAVMWYKKAGENGSINAQVNLGKFYLEGLGVEVDYDLAFKYFKKGADEENEYGITNLAYMYEKGLGVEKDIKYAKELYEKAIKNGFSLAQYNYGRFLIESELKDYEQGLKYVKKAAKQKSVEAQLYMAQLFLEGKVVEKSFVNSKKWYEIAIGEGSHEALYQLGKLYFEGKEVLQNYTTAFDYIFRSAKEGSIEGQKLLATMYEYGYGVKKDPAEAKLWQNLSGIEPVNFEDDEPGETDEVEEELKAEEEIIQEKEIAGKKEDKEKEVKRKNFIKNLFSK